MNEEFILKYIYIIFIIIWVPLCFVMYGFLPEMHTSELFMVFSLVGLGIVAVTLVACWLTEILQDVYRF